MATTTTTIEITIAAGRAMAFTTPGKAVLDIVSGALGYGYTSYRLNAQIGERVLGPYAGDVVVRIRPVAAATVTYNDRLQNVFIRGEVDPVTGVPDGILSTSDGKQFSSVPLIVTGGDQVDDVQTAKFVNGTGTVQWYRQNVNTLVVTDISGQTGTTYPRAIADVGFIVSAYATSWLPMAAGRLTRANVPTVPQTVVATAGNAQATITWTAPSSNKGSAVTGYIITRLPGGKPIGPISGTTYTDTGLTNGVTYTYYVQAVNTIGPGPVAASNTVTPAVAPADPYMLASQRLYSPAGSGFTVGAGQGLENNVTEIQIPGVPYETRAPRMCLPGFQASTNAANPESGPGNDLAVLGGGFIVNGVRYPVKFNGAFTGSVPNTAHLWSEADRDDIVIPANTSYYVYVGTHCDIGQRRMTNILAQTETDRVRSQTADITNYLNGTTAVPAANTPGAGLYGPCLIASKGWAAANAANIAGGGAGVPVVLVVGDSIGWMDQDQLGARNPGGVFGYVNRSLNDNVYSQRFAFGNLCAPGTTLASLNSTGFAAREAALRGANNNNSVMPFTCIHTEMAVNDTDRIGGFNNGAGPYLKTLLQGAQGNKRLIGQTIPPTFTPTPANMYGATLASQVQKSDNGWNNAVKTGQLPLMDKFIDVTAAFEDTPGSGKVKIPPINALAPVMTAASLANAFTVTLSQNFPVNSLLVFNPGATPNQTRVVASVVPVGDGTFTTNLYSALAAAYLINTPVLATNMQDGLHPSPELSVGVSNSAAGPIIAAKIAGNIYVG